MKCGVLSRSTGWHKLLLSLVGKTFDRILVLETRNMTSSGRLLGLQLPPIPSHLSDFMPSCVQSNHNGGVKECSLLAPSDLPLQTPQATLAFNPLCSKLSAGSDIGGDMSGLEQPQCLESHSSFALSFTDEQIEIIKPIDDKNKAASESPSPSGWAPYFNLGSNADGDAKASTNSSPLGAESHPTTPPEVDGTGNFNKEKEARENSNPQGHGLRSKLSNMLSLEKRISLTGLPLVSGHSSQIMMEMSRFQSTSFSRRAPMADTKICSVLQKESFARLFDLYDERNNSFSSVPSYAGSGGYNMGKVGDAASDIAIRPDLSWMEDKDEWGTEPWHSNQRNILMKTLHIMRCDIESLKMMLRSLDLPAARSGPLNPHLQGYMPYHPIIMRSNSTMLEMKPNCCSPYNEQQTENLIGPLKEDKQIAQTVEKDPSTEAGKDLCAIEELQPEKEDNDEAISTWTHGCLKKRKQWWRELLAAFGLTVWVITGAVLVAKAIGVPNLGVSSNVAYSGYWGRSDDEDTKTAPVQGAMGVVELSSYTFNDVIKKRPTFVMFYAPWCPHCQRLHPVWTQLAGVLNKKGYDVQLAIVDATKHTRLADQYEVPGFPTLIMFKNGKPVGRHRGARDIDTLMLFISSNK